MRAQQHLLNGINRMIPFVVAGALFAAFVSKALPGTYLANLLQAVGPGGGIALMLPVLAGFIAQSIAGWDGLPPGMLGGLLAAHGGSGMLGGILAGYLAGYVALSLQRWLRLPAAVEMLKSIVLLPAISALVVGAVMTSVINPPVGTLMALLQRWLAGMQGQSAIGLGLILGGMCAFDMGGPVNKAASLFALDLLAKGIDQPLAACVAGVMVPSMGMFLAMQLSPRRYSADELRLGKTAFLLGLSNIGEASIPVAMADPGRVIPAICVGGALAGAITMALGAGVRLPIGGFFTALVPGMAEHVGGYLLAIAAGSVTTALLVNLLKPVKAAVESPK